MPLAVIWISVVAGVVLGLWQRVAAPTTGPIRTFAVVAAGLVVALSLLPHAILSEGLGGLGAALASVALVPALERLVRIPFRNINTEGLRLELGYAGLLVHRFGDGVVMAVDGHGSELTWAVGAHEVPIVALVTLAYARRGLQQALVRAMLLGLASSLGYWLVRSMPGAWHDYHGWVDAIAAGILVHILAYEALPEQLETPRARALDVLGALLGLLVIVIPSLQHDAEMPDVALGLLRSGLEAAPVLLLGLLGSAAWLSRSGPRAAGSLGPIGITRPWPAVEAFAMFGKFLGWAWTLSYVVAASALAAAATAQIRRLTVRAEHPEATPGEPTRVEPACEEPRRAGYWATLEDIVLRIGGWIVLGLLAAGYIESFVPQPDALSAVGLPLHALLLTVIALAASIASGCAVPIAAALVHKGLSPTLAIAGLALGAVLGNSFEALTRSGLASRRAALRLAPLALVGIGIGLVADALISARVVEAPGVTSVGLGEWSALGLLVLLVAKSIWRVGVRGWLGSSLQTLTPGGRREQAHAHAH
jgi:hypothetical protein